MCSFVVDQGHAQGLGKLLLLHGRIIIVALAKPGNLEADGYRLFCRDSLTVTNVICICRSTAMDFCRAFGPNRRKADDSYLSPSGNKEESCALHFEICFGP